jgi:hypothetical protein
MTKRIQGMLAPAVVLPFLVLNAVLILWFYGVGTNEPIITFSRTEVVLLNGLASISGIAVLWLMFDRLSTWVPRKEHQVSWSCTGISAMALGTLLVSVWVLSIFTGLHFALMPIAWCGVVVWAAGFIALMLGVTNTVWLYVSRRASPALSPTDFSV